MTPLLLTEILHNVKLSQEEVMIFVYILLEIVEA